jgi:hypothetical protein
MTNGVLSDERHNTIMSVQYNACSEFMGVLLYFIRLDVFPAIALPSAPLNNLAVKHEVPDCGYVIPEHEPFMLLLKSG